MGRCSWSGRHPAVARRTGPPPASPERDRRRRPCRARGACTSPSCTGRARTGSRIRPIGRPRCRVVDRPVAGEGVAPGGVLGDVLDRRPEWVGHGRFGKSVLCRHRPDVVESTRAEQDQRPDRRHRHPGRHPADRAARSHDRPGVPPLPDGPGDIGADIPLGRPERAVQEKVVFAVHSAVDAAPDVGGQVGSGGFHGVEDEEDGQGGGNGVAREYRSRRGAGGRGVGGHALHVERAETGRGARREDLRPALLCWQRWSGRQRRRRASRPPGSSGPAVDRRSSS